MSVLAGGMGSRKPGLPGRRLPVRERRVARVLRSTAVRSRAVAFSRASPRVCSAEYRFAGPCHPDWAYPTANGKAADSVMDPLGPIGGGPPIILAAPTPSAPFFSDRPPLAEAVGFFKRSAPNGPKQVNGSGTLP